MECGAVQKTSVLHQQLVDENDDRERRDEREQSISCLQHRVCSMFEFRGVIIFYMLFIISFLKIDSFWTKIAIPPNGKLICVVLKMENDEKSRTKKTTAQR